MGSSSHTALILILDRDKIRGEVPHVLYLHRHNLLGEDQDDDAFVFWEYGKWASGCRCYKFVQVFQRWRNVTLGSASYLGLSLVRAMARPLQTCSAVWNWMVV